MSHTVTYGYSTNLSSYVKAGMSDGIESLDVPSPSLSYVTSLSHNTTTHSPRSSSDSPINEAEWMLNSKQIEEKFDDEALLHTRCPLLTGRCMRSKREEIRQYFHKTFSLYEKLFEVLKDDTVYYQQPEKLRHPLIFYYAHTACFYINKLYLAGVLKQRINEHIESTCAIGVDEMSWDDLNSEHYDWPSPATVRQYRCIVRTTIDDLISSLPLELPIQWEDPFYIILMGCEHERIHLETSSVLFRQLDIQYVQPHPLFRRHTASGRQLEEVPKNALLPVPGTTVHMGKAVDHPLYGWDNEYGSHTAEVSAFQASQFLVSNAQFYEFMKDGGYDKQEYWGDEGWAFLQFRNVKHPVFWVEVDRDDHGDIVYAYRCMGEIIDMPWDWPVDCNYIEAKAFCRWMNARASKDNAESGVEIRMPTEEEYYALLDHAFPEKAVSKDGTQQVNDQPYWNVAPGNINLEHGASSCAVNQFKFEHGFYDLVGNVWQWTETPIMPFNGFRFHPMYDDFSVPTFDTRHNLIKGGSWIATGNESTRLARYAFRRHFYQHAGFRYVLAPILDPAKFQRAIEKDAQVTQMIHHQYHDHAHSNNYILPPIPNYCKRVAEIATKLYKQYGGAADRMCGEMKAAEFGCGTGRIIFELASCMQHAGINFHQYTGLDLSTRFIRIASQLQSEGSVQYSMKKEGDLESYHEFHLSTLNLNLAQHTLDSILFMQDNVCNLHDKYTGYDLVIISNLLEYLPYPTHFLKLLYSRIHPGGILLLNNTYDWREKYTAKEEWIGGKKGADGESVESSAALAKLLQQLQFEPLQVDQCDRHVPMVLQDHETKYSILIGQVSCWRKK